MRNRAYSIITAPLVQGPKGVYPIQTQVKWQGFNGEKSVWHGGPITAGLAWFLAPSFVPCVRGKEGQPDFSWLGILVGGTNNSMIGWAYAIAITYA